VRLALAAALLCAAAFVLAGCDDLPGKPEHAERYVLPYTVKDFSELYGTNCAGCHGADGRLGPARALNDPLYLALVSDPEMTRVIARGVSSTSMPAFATSQGGTLTDEQIAAIVSEMRTRWARPQETTGIALPPYAAPAGDPQRGATAFATACASCHGADGKGGKSKGSIVDPSFLALTSDQSLRSTIIAGRTDLGMPDFRGGKGGTPMSAVQIADVVAWLAAQRTKFPGQPYAGSK
jgi:mono/diheme cytochrome c family protein